MATGSFQESFRGVSKGTVICTQAVCSLLPSIPQVLAASLTDAAGRAAWSQVKQGNLGMQAVAPQGPHSMLA